MMYNVGDNVKVVRKGRGWAGNRMDYLIDTVVTVREIDTYLELIGVDGNDDAPRYNGKPMWWLKEYEVRPASKYKAGDKVKVVNKSGVWNSAGNMDYLIGKVVTVRKAYLNTIEIDRADGDGTWCLRESDVIPAPKYKAGDRVKVVKKGSLWNINGKMDYLLNTVVTIQEISPIGLILVNRADDSGLSWYLDEGDIEPAGKYQVGDRIRVVKKLGAWNPNGLWIICLERWL